MDHRWRGNGSHHATDLHPLEDFDALFQFACEAAGSLPPRVVGGPVGHPQQVGGRIKDPWPVSGPNCAVVRMASGAAWASFVSSRFPSMPCRHGVS